VTILELLTQIVRTSQPVHTAPGRTAPGHIA
jgi:hypothetical protein